VTAVDSAGNESAYSNEVNTIPADRIVPATPQNLIVFDSSSAKIGIKWRKNTDADFMRYRIYRNTLPNAATKVDSSTANPTDTSKTFTGLTIGTKYYLRVTAVDSAGNESAYSNEVNAIPGVYVAPAAPQNLVVTDSSSRTIILKWRKNTEADFLRYRVYRGTSPAPSIKVDSTSGGIGDTSKTFTGLTNGTRYYFRVTAVDSVGIGSGYSNEANATAADRIAPTAPQNTAVTDSSSKTVTLKWRKNTEADFLRYRIYRGTSPGPTSQVDSTLGGNSDTIKTFTGLTNGTRYYFKVTAIDSTGNQSAYSNEVNAVPADRIPPAVPTKLVLVDTSSTKVGIKWSKNTEPDFMRYRIYRATSPNPTTKVDSTTAGVSDTSKTFTGLTNGTRYYLRVTAVDSAGNESPYSNEVSGVPKATLAVEGLSNQIPTEYMIAQNYPNPFNPSTLIRFGIPVRSSVHLQIYNVLGQCIERLVNEELEAGYFEKVWQAGIASGIYFYRIDAVSTTDPNNRFVQVKKMLLLK
jgi:fibronectin type 3 domain-containing protein